MSVQVTIELPDALAQCAREVAEKTGLRLEDVVMAWIDHGRLEALPEIDETPAERGARLLREGERTQPARVAAWEKFLKAIGAEGEPIGAERLRQLMIEDGVDPNDNSFSRGIIEMREE